MSTHAIPSPDPTALAWAIRVFSAQVAWHRLEVRGLERIPRGPALLVGNHNAGAAVIDELFLVHYYRERGFDEPIHVLAHDFFFETLRAGSLLSKIGVIPANRRSAEEVLRHGGKVLVYPGTDHDSLRPFASRAKVRLHGHRGFAKLAVDCGVPIVPVATAGAHEAMIVLAQGKAIARTIGLPRLVRWHSFPVALNLPWGLAVGPIAYLPYVPFPAKVTIEIGAPIDTHALVSEAHRRADAIDQTYRRTESALGEMLARLYAERRLPIVG